MESTDRVYDRTVEITKAIASLPEKLIQRTGTIPEKLLLHDQIYAVISVSRLRFDLAFRELNAVVYAQAHTIHNTPLFHPTIQIIEILSVGLSFSWNAPLARLNLIISGGWTFLIFPLLLTLL